MSFIVFTAVDLKSFVLLFQTDAPMIHVLHPKMMKLFKDLLNKFIDSNHLVKNYKPLSVSELIDLDLDDEKTHKAKCDVGIEAKSLMKHLDALESKRFYDHAKKCLVVCSNYMQQELPLDEQVLYDLQYLHPWSQQRQTAIGRLSSKVIDDLGISLSWNEVSTD